MKEAWEANDAQPEQELTEIKLVSFYLTRNVSSIENTIPQIHWGFMLLENFLNHFVFPWEYQPWYGR